MAALKPRPWAPVGSSTFVRVAGAPYQAGNPSAKFSGRGNPAGVFKRGPFRLGR